MTAHSWTSRRVVAAAIAAVAFLLLSGGLGIDALPALVLATGVYGAVLLMARSAAGSGNAGSSGSNGGPVRSDLRPDGGSDGGGSDGGGGDGGGGDGGGGD